MFRIFFYFFNLNDEMLHHCIVTMPSLPKKGDLISLMNINNNPNYEGFLGKVGTVITMLTVAQEESDQNNFLVLVRIIDFIEDQGILTLVIESDRIDD